MNVMKILWKQKLCMILISISIWTKILGLIFDKKKLSQKSMISTRGKTTKRKLARNKIYRNFDFQSHFNFNPNFIGSSDSYQLKLCATLVVRYQYSYFILLHNSNAVHKRRWNVFQTKHDNQMDFGAHRTSRMASRTGKKRVQTYI